MKIREKTKNFPRPLEKRLASYIMAAAAGLSLDSAQPADAAVVYTSVKEIREDQQPYRPVYATIDLNNDGQIDFDLIDTFRSESLSVGDIRSAFVEAEARPGNQIAIISTFYGVGKAQALAVGQEIGPKLNFFGGSRNQFGLAGVESIGSGPRSESGAFFNARNKFLALKLVIGQSTFFGWARVSTQLVGNKLALELVDYAYQSTPNLPILAGQGIPKPETAGLLDFTGEAVVGTLDKSQRGPALGLLAHGSDALPLWRK